MLHSPRLPVAREGWPFILIPAIMAAGLALGRRRRLALPFAAASLVSLGFFRDPEREVVATAGTVLAPADGRVIEVAPVDDPFVGPSVRVGIFLSPFDVHVNRSPIAGRVASITRAAGGHLAAYLPEAGEANARCILHLEGEAMRVTVVQIAGVVARRIVCRVNPGDWLAAGERFGMIRFGSRTDCYLPRDLEMLVEPGDGVTAGVTVLGRCR